MKDGCKNHTASHKTMLVVCICAAFFLWITALTSNRTGDSEEFRPIIGDPPYRIAIDAGHGGSDPGASGVVLEKEMTAQTSDALLGWLQNDANYIPLTSRDSYETTANPSERAERINAQSPDLLLSIHGNATSEGSTASGFECYPTVPGRTWHRESLYFAPAFWQMECRRLVQNCAEMGEYDTFIIREKQSSWWNLPIQKCGKNEASRYWKM